MGEVVGGVVSNILVSGGHILKCNIEFFRDAYSSAVTGKVTHRPTKVGKYSVWGSVRGGCVEECEGWVCGGEECEGWVCGRGGGVCVWRSEGWVCGGV